MNLVSSDLFREGMSRVAGAVHLVTVEGEEGRNGATAIAVSSVSDHPATLLVCLNAGSRTAVNVLNARRFVVNTLSAEDQPLADIFAGRTGLKGEDKFKHGDFVGGVLKSAIVSFECVIDTHSRIGTHEVIFGRVEAIHLGSVNNSALVYRNRGYLKIA